MRKRREQVITVPLGTPLHDIITLTIQAVLRKCHGDKVEAARLLGISRRTVHNRTGAYEYRRGRAA